MPAKTRSGKGSTPKKQLPNVSDVHERGLDNDLILDSATSSVTSERSKNYFTTGEFESLHEEQAEQYIANCRKYAVSVDPGYDPLSLLLSRLSCLSVSFCLCHA